MYAAHPIPLAERQWGTRPQVRDLPPLPIVKSLKPAWFTLEMGIVDHGVRGVEALDLGEMGAYPQGNVAFLQKCQKNTGEGLSNALCSLLIVSAMGERNLAGAHGRRVSGRTVRILFPVRSECEPLRISPGPVKGRMVVLNRCHPCSREL